MVSCVVCLCATSCINKGFVCKGNFFPFSFTLQQEIRDFSWNKILYHFHNGESKTRPKSWCKDNRVRCAYKVHSTQTNHPTSRDQRDYLKSN